MNLFWSEDHDQEEHLRIFPNRDNLYPIPFFGDIRRAEVLTMALNPAHDEFENRQWPPRAHPTALTGAALASRLLHYFDLPEPGPHPFFPVLSKMLLPIHCSYLRNAAHVDLSSLPTFRPREMLRAEQRQRFAGKVTAFVSRLEAVLRLAKRTKLLLVLDFVVGDGGGGQMSVWRLVCENCEFMKPYANSNGSVLPVLVKRGTNQTTALDEMTALVTSMRYEIREHLLAGGAL